MSRQGRMTAAVLAAALCMPASVLARDASARIGLAAHDRVPIYARPDAASHVLARIVEQTQVRVLARTRGWDHVAVWSGVHGWLHAGDVVFRRPWISESTYRAPEIHTSVRAHGPVAIGASAAILRSIRSASNVTLPIGLGVRVSAWKQDRLGHVWYFVKKQGWVSGADVQFGASHASGRAWSVVSGKGMWVTVGTMADTDPQVLISAARRAGITHLYLESAISPLGFHGRDVVGPVVEAAHRDGLFAIAWVYPYLMDVGSDVELAQSVAHYTSPHGQHFDGIAADLERNLALPQVRAFSQILRAELRHLPLIAVTYPPQSLPDFPFAEVARQYDAIAPMDYWHDSQSGHGTLYGHRAYGEEYARLFASESVNRIRSAAGPIPVVPIGQTFDNFGRLEMGPYAPTAAEIRGFLIGCKQSGAQGASFFQWMTATEPEWQTIGGFRY